MSHLQVLSMVGSSVIAGAFPASSLAQSGAVSPPVAGRSDQGAAANGQPAGTTAQPLTPAGGGGAAPNPFGGTLPMVMLGAFLVLMVVTSMMGSRKEKKKRAEMLGGLKRHDRVTTIGGLIGSVAEIRDDEIVLKVDEATNTKIRIVRSAVQTVLKRAPGTPGTPGTGTPGGAGAEDHADAEPARA